MPSATVIGVMRLSNARREPAVVPFSAVSAGLARSCASLAAVAVHRRLLNAATFKDAPVARRSGGNRVAVR